MINIRELSGSDVTLLSSHSSERPGCCSSSDGGASDGTRSMIMEQQAQREELKSPSFLYFHYILYFWQGEKQTYKIQSERVEGQPRKIGKMGLTSSSEESWSHGICSWSFRGVIYLLDKVHLPSALTKRRMENPTIHLIAFHSQKTSGPIRHNINCSC